ncbi:50S ribosomal protein L29 [Halostagnicola sp. A56]|uniref:50S ribosomal protein L29 n=1 Tax=Halostagnicola sp. A56 TaxID=1495067 RepID=UPI0004A157FE|nr:50S ribosomal protein L29 [Halostagnicola sp. A56]KDE60333.1 50S ribosomal protein L29 [Halostagnicola sp. A56]
MAILHVAEVRDMTAAERAAELEELETELLNQKSVLAAGGAPENPGRIGELSRTIARIKTVQQEEGDFEDDASSSGSDEAAADTDE